MTSRRSALFFLALLALVLAAPAAHADTFTLTLTPGTFLSGPPGSILSWGYVITTTNQSVLTSLEIIGITVTTTGPFIPDASVFDFPSVAAHDSVSGPLFDVEILPLSLVGTTGMGTVTLTGRFCTFGTCDPEIQVSADFSMAVTAPRGAVVPEPSTLLLLGTGLAGLLRRRITTG